MIDLKILREQPDRVKRAIASRGVDLDIDHIISLDRKLLALRRDVEQKRHEQKEQSKQVVDSSKRTGLKQQKQIIKTLEDQARKLSQHLIELLYQVPNLPFAEVPVGAAAANQVLRQVGNKKKFTFPALDYLTLANNLDIIDIERAAKTAGSRFGYLKGGAAHLEFGIVMYTLARLTDRAWVQARAKTLDKDLATSAFVPIVPPVMIRPEMFRAMGKLDPGQEDERYRLKNDELYLVGSAEHSLGPLHADETLAAEALPRRYLGFSTCFRREAGTYGQDTKGILRVHQFDKLEMFSFAHPDRSRLEHRLFLAIQEALLQELQLPYQVVAIATAEMVSTDAEQFDCESWLPGQRQGKGEYRETHSASNSTDYQARRLNARYRDEAGTKGYVHTVNGTAFAIGRTLVALIENYQTKDGAIAVPKALQAYVPFKKIPAR